MTVGGPGLVAVGGFEKAARCAVTQPKGCYAAVWTSTDGLTWTRAPYDETVFGGRNDKQMMHAVTTVGSDLVAVGTSVWVSHDGITWTRTYQDPAIVMSEHDGMATVTFARGVLFATGDVDGKAFWTATPQD